MSTLPVDSHSPQESVGNVQHLEIRNPPEEPAPNGPGELSSLDWDEVHRVVQQSLSGMSLRICADHSPIRARGGRTSARAFFLFSYYSFDVPADHGIEAVVVGLDFLQGSTAATVVVVADIVREDTGVILWDGGRRTVPKTRVALLAAAQEIAGALSEWDEMVVEGLKQPAESE